MRLAFDLQLHLDALLPDLLLLSGHLQLVLLYLFPFPPPELLRLKQVLLRHLRPAAGHRLDPQCLLLLLFLESPLPNLPL